MRMIDENHVLTQDGNELVIYGAGEVFGKELARVKRRGLEEALEEIDRIPTDVEHTLAILSGEAARRQTAHQLAWVTILLGVCVMWGLAVVS